MFIVALVLHFDYTSHVLAREVLLLRIVLSDELLLRIGN
jgi:hypothetical protein